MEKTFKIDYKDSGRMYVNGKPAKKLYEYNRAVWVCGEVVVKVDTQYDPFSHIYNQCKAEWMTWIKWKDTKYAQYLAPVYQFGFVKGLPYVVQKFLDKNDFSETEHAHWTDVAFQKRHFLESEMGLHDLHSGNYFISLETEVIVVFDYALNKYTNDDSEVTAQPNGDSYQMTWR